MAGGWLGGGGDRGLVDRTFWRVWVMWPMSVASDDGQYLAALEYVSPGQDE